MHTLVFILYLYRIVLLVNQLSTLIFAIAVDISWTRQVPASSPQRKHTLRAGRPTCEPRLNDNYGYRLPLSMCAISEVHVELGQVCLVSANLPYRVHPTTMDDELDAQSLQQIEEYRVDTTVNVEPPQQGVRISSEISQFLEAQGEVRAKEILAPSYPRAALFNFNNHKSRPLRSC